MAGERERQEVADLYVVAREGVIRYLVASGLDGDAAAEATQEAFSPALFRPAEWRRNQGAPTLGVPRGAQPRTQFAQARRG